MTDTLSKRSTKRNEKCASDFSQVSDMSEFKDFKKNGVCFDKEVEAISQLICQDCQVGMVMEDHIYLCPECGLTKDLTEEQDVIYTNSNSNPDATSTLRIIGKCAKDYQRHHVQVTSDYSKRKKLDSKSEFERHFKNYKHVEEKTGQFAPPWNVFERASDLFNIVQQHYTKRSTKRKGVQGACIYFESRRVGMAKEPKLVARIVGVSETSLNNGIDLLQLMHREGLVDIPIMSVDDDQQSRITQYCNLLDIDMKYVPFIYDFVEHAIDKHVGDESEAKSKCVGTIYFLSKIKGMAHVLANLKKCDISKPTYQRFFREVCQKHKKFKKLYETYDKVLGITYKRANKKINA